MQTSSTMPELWLSFSVSSFGRKTPEAVNADRGAFAPQQFSTYATVEVAMETSKFRRIRKIRKETKSGSFAK